MRRKRITITIRSDALKKLDTIIDGEQIRNRSNGIETIVLEKFAENLISTAVILCADKGVEFKSRIMSKLLFPINEKTLLEQNIFKLKESGVKKIILGAGHWKKDYKEVLDKEKIAEVKVIYFEKINGTAGIIREMKDELNEPLLITNGDILLRDIDIEDMVLFHKKHRGLATIAVTTHEDPSELGSVFMKGNKVLDFQEKIKKGYSLMVNAGVYILEPSVCNEVPDGYSMIENDVFPKLARAGKL